jgi:hypothetical protein
MRLSPGKSIPLFLQAPVAYNNSPIWSEHGKRAMAGQMDME